MSAKFMQVLATQSSPSALNKMNGADTDGEDDRQRHAVYLPAQQMMPAGKFAFPSPGSTHLPRPGKARQNDERRKQVMGLVAGIRAIGKPDPASAATIRPT